MRTRSRYVYMRTNSHANQTPKHTPTPCCNLPLNFIKYFAMSSHGRTGGRTDGRTGGGGRRNRNDVMLSRHDHELNSSKIIFKILIYGASQIL